MFLLPYCRKTLQRLRLLALPGKKNAMRCVLAAAGIGRGGAVESPGASGRALARPETRALFDSRACGWRCAIVSHDARGGERALCCVLRNESAKPRRKMRDEMR